MKTTQGFDCLRMKRDLQGKLHKQWKGLTTREIQAAIENDLATSQSTLAKWWRRTAPAGENRERMNTGTFLDNMEIK